MKPKFNPSESFQERAICLAFGNTPKSQYRHAFNEIKAILARPETQADMLRQLERLDRAGAVSRTPRLANGRLLYMDAGKKKTVDSYRAVLGYDEYPMRYPSSMTEHSLCAVGSKPCWDESSGDGTYVAWGSRHGKPYLVEHRMFFDLQDIGGVPCYIVHRDTNRNGRSFAVVDETEGKPYGSVHSLHRINGEPAYLASKSMGSRRHSVIVIGTEEVVEAMELNGPTVHADGSTYVMGVMLNGSGQIWRDAVPILSDDAVHEVVCLSAVGGQVAYAVRSGRKDRTAVHLLGQVRTVTEIGSWKVPHDADNRGITYNRDVFGRTVDQNEDGILLWNFRDGPTWEVYANWTKLCDGKVAAKDKKEWGNPIGYIRSRSVGILLEGEDSPRVFDLAALGVIPATTSND